MAVTWKQVLFADGDGSGLSGVSLSGHTHSYLPTTLSSGYTVGMGSWGLRNTTPYGWIQFGPANGTWAHIYESGTSNGFYMNSNLHVADGYQVLHAGNYSSYANFGSTALTAGTGTFSGQTFDIGDDNGSNTRLTIHSQYDQGAPSLHFRSGHPNNSNTWTMGKIDCGDDSNYNGILGFYTSNSGYNGGIDAGMTLALSLDSSQNATFTGDLTVSGHATFNGQGIRLGQLYFDQDWGTIMFGAERSTGTFKHTYTGRSWRFLFNNAGNDATLKIQYSSTGTSGGTITTTDNEAVEFSSTGATFAGNVIVDTLQADKYYNEGGTYLFKADSGAGAQRHLNLFGGSADPSVVTGNQTGITWGTRSDNKPYYIIYCRDKYNSGYGTYARLRLNWHTGMEFGAHTSYGGFRFFSDTGEGDAYSGGSVGNELFSIGKGDSHVRVENNLYTNNLYTAGTGTFSGELTVKGEGGDTPHSHATGLGVCCGTGGANLLSVTNLTYHNWLPYSDGENYYSAGEHHFRSGDHNTTFADIGANATFAGTVTDKNGRLAVTGDSSTKASANGDICVSNWFRVYGNGGLYFNDHGGGWYMNDSNWMKVYADKGIYTGGSASFGGNDSYFGNTSNRCGLELKSSQWNEIFFTNTSLTRATRIGMAYYSEPSYGVVDGDFYVYSPSSGMGLIVKYGGGVTLCHEGSTTTVGGALVPSADNTKDLGSSALRWENIHVGDLHVNEINAQQQEHLNVRMDQGYQFQYDGTEVAKVNHNHSGTYVTHNSNDQNVIKFGSGGNTGNTAHSYAIFQEAGAWSSPFPDLRIAYHTGIKLGAYTGYGGTRFYSNSDMVTELFSVGDGDNHVRVQNDLHVGNDLNVSGWTEMGEGFNADGDSTLSGNFSMQGVMSVTGTGAFTGQTFDIGTRTQASTRLTLLGIYTNRPSIHFRSGHPNNSNTWTMGKIDCGDDGNYNGILGFYTSNSGYNGGIDAGMNLRLSINSVGNAVFTGNVIVDTLQADKYYNEGGTYLFKADSGAGAQRHLNLFGGSEDPSNVTGNQTGITWGTRSDNKPYYIIYCRDKYNSGYGTYARLRLNWHTGMEFGAHTSYGGFRFFSDTGEGDAYSGGSVGNELFSIGKGDSHVRVENNLYIDGQTAIHAGNYSSYALPTTLSSGYTVGMGSWGLRNTTPYGWIQFGPANGTWAHIYESGTSNGFYMNSNLHVADGYQVLHAGNYSSYANFGSTALTAGNGTFSGDVMIGSVTEGNAWHRYRFQTGGAIAQDGYCGIYPHVSSTGSCTIYAYDYTPNASGNIPLYISATATTFGGSVVPSADNTKDLGSSSLRWENIHVGDLHVNEINGRQQENLNVRMDQGYQFQYDGTEVAKVNHNHSGTYVTHNSNDQNVIKFGSGGNTGNTAHSYAIFQEAGAWSSPFPDLRIAYHTGIKLGAYTGYGGTRFYSNSDMVTELFSVGDGDNHVRVANTLYVSNDLTVSGYAEMGQGFHSDDNSTLQGSFSMQGDLDVTGDASFGGQLDMHQGSYEGLITFGSNSSWRCGIRQHDDGDAELRIWAKHVSGRVHIATGYDGQPASIAKPTDGFVVDHNNVGIGNFSSTDPAYKLDVKGTLGVTLGVNFGSGLDVAKSIIAQEDIQAKGDFVSADGSAGITQSGNSKVAIVDDRGDAHELTFKNGLLVTYEIH